uniref:Uncharacterized protein n=1 Tax=Timema monikensis TaxID=170555 RepID=A0A7R9EEU4_9NEOP|nr:unnamed protein product [Timema monikensis]
MLGKNIPLLYFVNNGLTLRTIPASKVSIPRNCLQSTVDVRSCGCESNNGLTRTAPQAVSTREEPTTDGTIYCWLSTSAPTARPGYVMPGGGKKAVFPTMALHDHEKNRVTANEQDRIKKFHQSRGRKYALHLVHSKRLPSSGQHDIQFHQSRADFSSVKAIQRNVSYSERESKVRLG